MLIERGFICQNLVRALVIACEYNTSMRENIKWYYYDLKRLWRLWVRPEASAYDLCRVTGVWWLWIHGARREYKVRLWKTAQPGWYALDLAIPRRKLAVEADGSPHYTVNGFRHDIARDEKLHEKGWQVMRINYSEIKADPRGVRKRVRKFLKG